MNPSILSTLPSFNDRVEDIEQIAISISGSSSREDGPVFLKSLSNKEFQRNGIYVFEEEEAHFNSITNTRR